MPRASDAQKAQRLNRARELLRQVKERSQAVTVPKMFQVPNICSKTFRSRSYDGTSARLQSFSGNASSSFFITETYSRQTMLSHAIIPFGLTRMV